jgi:predicted transcriptional regulator
VVVDNHISEEVLSFLSAYIDSVFRLDILLLLMSQPERWLSTEDVARELRLFPEPVARELQVLTEHGLIEGATEPQPTFRYRPSSTELDRIARLLERTYAERRTTVITLIYSRPNDKLRGFADAFKLRGEAVKTDKKTRDDK